MFLRIYGKRNKVLGRLSVHLKLQGEITELFGLFEEPEPDPQMVSDELADIGARIFSLANICNVDLQAALTRLS